MRLFAALLGLAALAGCGDATRSGNTPGTVYRADGISAVVPAGWHAVARPLTAVSSPVQELVVASYGFRQARRDPNCAPTTALRQMPPGGALLFMWEYRGPSRHDVAEEPPRPKRFRLDPRTLQPYECMGRSYMVRFRDHGRVFQAHMFLGPRASANTRRRLLGVLDSLRVERQSPQGAAVWVPPSRLFAKDPYLGVACPVGNAFACDRIGVSIWLRAPARAVTAWVDGMWVRLDDPLWSGPRRHGLRKLFAGFLHPAGLLHGPHALHPVGGGSRWVGRPPVRLPLALMIERGPDTFLRTSLVTDLRPGWG